MFVNSTEWYSSGQVVKLLGHDVFYKRSGKGEVLVCLHGFPTSSWDFAAVWQGLTGRFDVVVHDLIGLGRSAKPRQRLTVALQADVVEALMASLGIESAHLLAHDLGDTVAQELLARQLAGTSPVKWLSCIFMNGGLFPEAHRPRLIQRLLASPLGPLIARLSSERTFSRTMTGIFSAQHPPTAEFLQQSWQLLNENDGQASVPRLIQYMKERKVNRQRWLAPLENSQVPLRLINGIQDPIAGLQLAERYRQLVHNADVVLLDDAGHYPHVETPDAVLEGIMEFHARHFKHGLS
jgi:pimeloyl-ACP methyl ester carboxylesterase